MKVLHDEYAQPQIVFLNAHRCLEDGVEPQSERAWLFKIAEHVVMYRRRTISRRARVEFPVDVGALADLIVAPEQEAAELDGLPDALARIPEAQQRAIVLREWYGLSYREVAAELGLSVSATETLIFRARCRLAQELGGPAPTVRRRRPLSLASPLASLKWLLGGGTTLKALVGVTSVAVLVAGSTKIGLLPSAGPPAATAATQRALVLPAVTGSRQVVARRATSVVAGAHAWKVRVWAPGKTAAPVAAHAVSHHLVVAEDPAPAETSTTAPVSVEPPPRQNDGSAAAEPAATPPSETVPPTPADPGNQGHGAPGGSAGPPENASNGSGNANGNTSPPAPAPDPSPPSQAQGAPAVPPPHEAPPHEPPPPDDQGNGLAGPSDLDSAVAE